MWNFASAKERDFLPYFLNHFHFQIYLERIATSQQLWTFYRDSSRIYVYIRCVGIVKVVDPHNMNCDVLTSVVTCVVLNCTALLWKQWRECSRILPYLCNLCSVEFRSLLVVAVKMNLCLDERLAIFSCRDAWCDESSKSRRCYRPVLAWTFCNSLLLHHSVIFFIITLHHGAR